MKRIVFLILLAFLVTACATAPSGRKQLLLMSGNDMSQMGSASFDKLKATDKLSKDTRRLGQAQCVVNALVRVLPAKYAQQSWEVQLFEDANPNAFALPGGKVGVNTGMFAVAKTQDELAAVIGHEIAHVISQHANERVSQQMATGIGIEAIGAYSGTRTSPENTKALMSALGLGAQLGVLLPYSRVHESEADVLGQQLMARAGFDPAAAVALWQHMQAADQGGRPPQLLSTHPDPRNRIQDLAGRAPALQADYRAARAAGRVPKCF